MRPNRNLLIRRAFAVAVLIVATLGLTSCRKADHYVAIFGPMQTEPGCGVFCVGTQSIVGQDGQFKVKRDDKVRFINLTTQVVNIELDFMYPDHTADVKEFSLKPGKSKRIKIKENLPEGGTTINIRWGVAAPPPSGGPNMIVEP